MSALDRNADDRKRLRAEVLARLGADDAVADELLAYDTDAFEFDRLPTPLKLPLADEPHVDAWERYARAPNGAAFGALQGALVQLRFPIRQGISETDEYRSATRAGTAPDPAGLATGLELEHPDAVRIVVNPTAAGRVPVIAPRGRADFVSLLQALTLRNEPLPVPDSQGGATIGGYNNWERIERHRNAWKAGNPNGDWDSEFRRMVGHKELYQDCFMILSDGPYSSVAAARLGVSDAEWPDLSFTIRMHHECTHYATSRLLGSMQNRMLDELIADYFGIVAAAGRFRADWFLAFVGLESFPAYREGGRLQNYRGDPSLSEPAFVILQRLLHDAARNLEDFDAGLSGGERSTDETSRLLLALGALTLEEMASEVGVELLRAEHGRWSARKKNVKAGPNDDVGGCQG